MPRWDTLDNNLGNTKIHIASTGNIEDNGLGFLQVDFANKNIGGGVLRYGCVQEEIRFVICPELIVSRLFVEQLRNSEAVIITGVERYNNYSGYGDSFAWAGDYVDKTPFDVYGRRKTTICVIDAIHFSKPHDQYQSSLMLRELNKLSDPSPQKKYEPTLAGGEAELPIFSKALNGGRLVQSWLRLLAKKIYRPGEVESSSTFSNSCYKSRSYWKNLQSRTSGIKRSLFFSGALLPSQKGSRKGYEFDSLYTRGKGIHH
ncbi:hypothetical protein D910_11873, partial [Dendroctonus ponderosae]